MPPLSGQPERLAFAVLVGVGIALWFDLMGGVRRGLGLRRWPLHLLDLVTVLAGGTGLLAALWAGVHLEFRFYVLWGLAAGAGLYGSLAAAVLRPLWAFPFRLLYRLSGGMGRPIRRGRGKERRRSG